MNMFSIKSYCLVAFGILFIGASGLSLNANPVLLLENERVYIHNLATEIDKMFVFFQDHISLFVDSKDKTPYRVYVARLSDKLDQFEQEVMLTLASKLVVAKQQGSLIFYQGLTIVHEVLVEFLAKLNRLRIILQKYINVRNDAKKAIALGREIEPYIKDLLDSRTIANLENKIDQVYTLIASVGDQELSAKLFEIKQAMKNIKGNQAAKNISDAAILNCLTTKLRHNTAG